MTPVDLGLALGIAIAAVVGVRSSVRLAFRYRGVAPLLATWRERLMLGTFVAVAWTITVVALWIGFLTIRRLLGFQVLPGTPPVTGLMVIVVLFIPTLLDIVVTKIAKQ